MTTGTDLALEAMRKVIEKGSAPTLQQTQLWFSWLTDPFPSVDELDPYIGRNWVLARKSPRLAHYDRHLSQKQFNEAQLAALKARAHA